jgi:hypothetical protein
MIQKLRRADQEQADATHARRTETSFHAREMEYSQVRGHSDGQE